MKMKTIEVYKTDIDDISDAEMILDNIRQFLPGSIPSIDLEDSDKVLRIEHPAGNIEETVVKNILENFGYEMEILP